MWKGNHPPREGDAPTQRRPPPRGRTGATRTDPEGAAEARGDPPPLPDTGPGNRTKPDDEFSSLDLIRNWGWEQRPDGSWHYPPTGDTGYFLSDGRFVNEGQNKVWDPTSGEIEDYEGEPIQPGEFLRRNPTRPPPVRSDNTPNPFSFDIPGTRPGAPMGQAIDGRTPEGMLQAGGWSDNGNGTWTHTSGQLGYFLDNGTFLNKDSGKVWDPTTGNMSDIDAAGLHAAEPGVRLQRRRLPAVRNRV